MTRREEIAMLLWGNIDGLKQRHARDLADAILALPPVETGELVKRLRTNTSPELDVWSPKNEALRFEAAAALTQQEAEIARLLHERNEWKRLSGENAKAADTYGARADELQRKLDHAVKFIWSVGNRFDWATHPGSIEGQTHKECSEFALSQKDEGQ